MFTEFEKHVLWPWKTALEIIIIFNLQTLRMGPNAAPCNRTQSVTKNESHTIDLHTCILFLTSYEYLELGSASGPARY